MKSYLKLLLAREAKEVVGKKGFNLWLLTAVLVATFISIAFSEGSMIYLKEKMEDPFTNWVSISRSTDDNQISNEEFNEFRDSLYLDENKERFDYNAILTSQYSYYTMVGDSGRNHYLSARFFEHLNTKLVRKVLDKSNIVEGCALDTTLLQDNTMGLIITLNAAKLLGYNEKKLPSYIGYLAHNDGVDSLGMKYLIEDFVPIALPVLAVVKRLPNNAQMLSGNFLYEQFHNGGGTSPFHIPSHSDDYLRQLAFYVAEGMDSTFCEVVKKAVPEQFSADLHIYDDAGENYQTMRTWKAGRIYKIDFGNGETDVMEYQKVANAIEASLGDRTQVCRVFSLDTKDVSSPHSMFLSVEFNSLHQINAFESFAKAHKIQLEMEQVHSKQNFDAVTTMAGILSAAMVIFSIVCIIMFMVNMLQSYFQKVKRNIGTFKAFGMNGKELIKVYVLILVMIVLSGVVLALLITWAIQGLLPIIGVEKDGFNYLSLWNTTTYIATAVIFISTVLTVVFVMTRLLSQTPGDLIYDRN